MFRYMDIYRLGKMGEYRPTNLDISAFRSRKAMNSCTYVAHCTI